MIFIFFRIHNKPVCYVPNCRAPKDIPHYNFPVSNANLLHVWSKRIGLSAIYDTDLYSNITICQTHFHENCFDKKSMELKSCAIPSLNLIGKNLY